LPTVKLLEQGRQRLDRYELVGELASGGMATVFLGRIQGAGGFQRFVAIKRLHPHLASEQEFVEMFLDEARLAASIHHPNVVPILEVGTADKGYYLVMEYIEGDTMARLLARATTAREKIPVPIVMRIVLDTLAGLHAAHELKDDQDRTLNLVHRDVSPQNILVGINGTARITDFGVARAATRLSSTRSGQLKGKLAYMAPEQARGGVIDRRADLFSVGTVLWESLADKRLFKGEGEAETLNRVLFEPIPGLRSVAPSIPIAIDAVTMKSLEREPDKRYATALDFAEDLERAARSGQILASVREVAEYVQKVLGRDIAEQREKVRSWLARSEPSRTDLDDRDALGHPLQPTASSVSSTAISIPANAIGDAEIRDDEIIELSAKLPAPKKKRWVGVALVALAGGAAAAYFATRPLPGASPTLADTRPPTAATAPPAVASGVSSVSSAPAASSSAPAAIAPSALPTVQQQQPRYTGPWKKRPQGGTPAPADDIPRNPYR
jgi:serine/threonine-protein kinase